MGNFDLWVKCIEAYHAISQFYVSVMDEKAVEYELPEGGGWLLLPALTFDPDIISAEKLRIRSPYTSARRYQAGIEALAAKGFLVHEIGMVQAYRLSPTGRQAILAVIQAGYDCMQTLQPLNRGELETLARTLFKLVKASLDAPEPPGKWSITHSRKIDPGENAAVMVRIDQYLSDLAAYRDDSHLAAWRIHDIEGHAWELLTVLWREGAHNIDDLVQWLPHRGFLQEETQAALAALVDRGWVRFEEGVYRLTDPGEVVRNHAEADTDRNFYRPWSCLSAQEITALEQLIMRFKDGFQSDG